MSNTVRQSSTLEDIREMRVSKSTKAGYRSGLNQIKKWITSHGDASMLLADGSIDLQVFKYEHFLTFIEWMYRNTSNKPSTLASYRSAMRDLYKRQSVPVPPQYDVDMKDLFQGMRRHHAEQTQSGTVKDSGKRPMGYSMYETLCLEGLKQMDGGFVHLFLTLSWNLMCRSISTQTVLFDHITFEEDAIGVVFHKSKTDQAGDKRRDPRHIYANPFSPKTCVFLAFGVYFACHPQLEGGNLFPGGKQRDRFGKALARLVGSSFHMEAGTIGTHSIRKGVATFACSGSTCGPSMASVCLRCGWTLGHVLERYIHYERAGDQYLGRIVAGLPNSKPEFAALPPHFPHNVEDDVQRALHIVFPRLANLLNLRHLLSLVLASLVYHSDWLMDVLPARHSLLSSALFSNPTLLSDLKGHVTINSERYTPTGIPPHVNLFKIIDRNHSAIVSLPGQMRGQIEDVLQQHGAASGHITRQFLEAALNDFAHRLNHPASPAIADPVPSVPGQLFTWGGRLSQLPQNFEFPTADAATAWRLWWLGNKRLGYPPFKQIVPVDLATRKQRKLLSEWKFAMGRFERACLDAGVTLGESPTEVQVSRSFEAIAEYLRRVCSLVPSKRPRRITQLHVISLVRTLRAVRDTHG